MDEAGTRGDETGRGRQGRFLAGFALMTLILLGVGEAALRVVPPREVQPYLPDDDRPGPFRSDSVYGVQYRSWEAFRADYQDALAERAHFFTPGSGAPIWAMFGSSFVQAPGMLADTARQAIPNRRIFHLGRNEFVYVRAAQIELLLEHGLRPERIIFALMPLDVAVLARHSFAMVRAGPGGALAYEPRLPVVGGGLVRYSRLALSGWVRAELHHHIPWFRHQEMTRRMDPRILAEVEHLFGAMGEATRRFRVPVTILLIPNWEQIVKGAGYAFQDALRPLAEAQGFDVLDPREPFRTHPDQASLFIPDKHFSDRGNRILLAELVRHLHALGEAADVTLPEGFAQ